VPIATDPHTPRALAAARPGSGARSRPQ
jgi:hypothetical protein